MAETRFVTVGQTSDGCEGRNLMSFSPSMISETKLILVHRLIMTNLAVIKTTRALQIRH